MASRTRSQRLNGFNPLAYLGVTPLSPVNFNINNRPPTVNDYANFYVGDTWLDNSSYPTPPRAENFWMLVSKAAGESTWVNFGGGASLLTLTGNVGGPVPGDVNDNINTIGDGVGILVTGNPATNTLTWSLLGGGGGVATQSFLTDDGNVEVPIGAVLVPPVGSIGQITIAHAASVGNGFSNTNTRIGVDIHTVGVALDNSIIQPPTNMAGTAGMYSLGVTDLATDRFMYNYGTHNTFLGYQSGSLGLTTAAAQNNTFIGYQAGTATTTAAQSTYVGSLAGSSNQTSNNNTFVGYASGIACNGGGGKNTSCGSTSLNGLTTGTQNSAFGDLSLQVTTGSNNTALGYNAGSAYVGNESGNVTIGSGNTGTVAESNTFRVATAAGLTRAFVQGSYGVNPPGGGVQTVIQDMNGQLGTMAGVGPNPFATTGFYATNSTSPLNYFTLNAFTTIGLDTAVFDLGGNFNTATSTYTCPNTGYYWFNAMITLNVVPNTITGCTMAYQVNGGGGAGVFGPLAFNPFLYQSTAPNGFAFAGSWMCARTAGDTINFQVSLGGSAGNTGYDGGSGRTFLQGYQIF